MCMTPVNLGRTAANRFIYVAATTATVQDVEQAALTTERWLTFVYTREVVDSGRTMAAAEIVCLTLMLSR